MDRQTADRIIAALGPARRHLARIKGGELEATPAVAREMESSVDRCLELVEAEVRPTEHETAVQGLRGDAAASGPSEAAAALRFHAQELLEHDSAREQGRQDREAIEREEGVLVERQEAGREPGDQEADVTDSKTVAHDPRD